MMTEHGGIGPRALKRLGSWTGPLLAAALLLWPAGDAFAQAGQITGRVVDGGSGQPLNGASVQLEGTPTRTTTDGRGLFLLQNVPPGTHTIAVTLIGYGRKTAQVTVGVAQTATQNFQLYAQAIPLDAMVVTGTAGQTRRKELGNSMTNITSQDLESVTISDLGDAIQGMAPGVIVRDQGGGQPGAGSAIILRGVNTLGAINPLIYVDGVRLEQANHGDPDEANVVATALDGLEARDIENIEIVRGAAATTLYGTEAAGGVIQIFTKTGGRGAPSWTFSMDQGVSSVGHVGPKEDPTGLHLNDCTMDLGCPASGSWFRDAHLQKYNLSVRGGADLTYYASANWERQLGVIAPSAADKLSLRANFSFKPFEALTIRVNNMFSRKDMTFIPSGNNAEGFLLNVMRGERDYTPNHNDSLILEMKLDQIVDQFITGANISWTPTAGMLHRLNVGMDYSHSDYTEERPWGYWRVPEGNRENDEDADRNITVDYAGTWNTRLPSDFTATTSWGAQYYDEFSWGVNGFGERFAGPGSKLITSGVETEVFSEQWVRTASGGFFLQEMIGWRDRLFITGGARWDGFSTFGEDFGMAMYPKVSAAYTISDHTFWPEWWEAMKLRVALGETGRAPGPFAKNRTWASVSGDTRQPGVILAEYGNPDIGPERTREVEVGFEGSAFDGRFSYDFTYFDQETRNALLRIQLPPSIGTEQTILTNLGEVANQGLELTANLSLLRSPNVSFDVGGNIGTANNEIVALGNVDDTTRLGTPVDALFGSVVVNGDEVGVNPIYERQYLGPAVPTRTWGINTRLTLFRRLSIDALGEGQGGHVHEASIARQNVARRFWAPCQYMFDALEQRDAGDPTAYDQTTAEDRSLCHPSFVSYGMWTTAGDFFKLRSVALSYRLPESMLPGSISSATIRLQGRNLVTITDYPGLDPELAEGGASRRYGSFEYYDVPPARQFQLNLTVNF